MRSGAMPLLMSQEFLEQLMRRSGLGKGNFIHGVLQKLLASQ